MQTLPEVFLRISPLRLRNKRRRNTSQGVRRLSCFEAGDRLTPARAEVYSRLHPRCGTSFLLVVMVVAIFVFAPLGLPAWYLLLASRILGVPLIAGLSFEVIKWAGKNRRKGWVRSVMWPGMQLQKLTTREPDLSQPQNRDRDIRAPEDPELTWDIASGRRPLPTSAGAAALPRLP